MQVVEASVQPLEVADPVAVGVHVLLDVEAVEDGVLVPEVVNGHAGIRSNRRAVLRRRVESAQPR
jgi:hypothetical protein